MMKITEALKARRSYYAINRELPVAIDRVMDMVKELTELVPDAFNMKSGRAAVVHGEKQDQLWNKIYDVFEGKVAREKIDSFRATSFDDLFEAVKAIPWADYIPEDGKFWVTKANSVSSKLFSPSDIQKIVKKAMVEKLKQTYHADWFEETGASYPLRISIVKDIVTLD